MSSFRHQRLIGTFVEIHISSAPRFLKRSQRNAEERIHTAVLKEMVSLENIFSVYKPDSEINRWKRREDFHQSDSFVQGMSDALHWQLETDGLFNTSAEAILRLWREASGGDYYVDETELQKASSAIQQPLFSIVNDEVIAIGDISHVALNSFAKGWIVDRAIDVAVACEPEVTITVNAGGDLRHRGKSPIAVGIDNPFRPYDNEPPLGHIELFNGAVATSGGSRRGILINGSKRSHVIHPISGLPAGQYASVTVNSPLTATADALATACSLLPPVEAGKLAEKFGSGCLMYFSDSTTPAFKHRIHFLPSF